MNRRNSNGVTRTAMDELQNFFKPPVVAESPRGSQVGFAAFGTLANFVCARTTFGVDAIGLAPRTVYLPFFFKMFIESPNDALGMLIELRNPKYGKSKKHICRVILFALSVYYPDVYESFLDNFIENGCWVDVLWITKWSIDAKLYSLTGLHRMAKSIKADLPLAAKWAPNEKSKWNRAPYYLANKLMGILGVTPKEYRHNIVKLRKKLNIVETNMSTKQFADINFSELTSTARKNYANAFNRDHNAAKEISQDRIELSRRYTKFLKGPATTHGVALAVSVSSTVRARPPVVLAGSEIDYELFDRICKSF